MARWSALRPTSGSWSAADITRDGKRLLVNEYFSESKANAYELDAATSQLTSLNIEYAGKRKSQRLEAPELHVMKPGTVFVDIAIDQGGCAETSRPERPTRLR